MNNIPILLGLLLVWGLSRGITPKTFQSLCFWVVNLGFGFWYWLPSIQMLNFPPVEVIYEARLVIELLGSTAWLVLLYQFVVNLGLIALGAFIKNSSLIGSDEVRPDLWALIAVISAGLCFLVRFGQYGTDVLIDILTARMSSRELLLYFNRSAGAVQSLVSLWDIVNIWLGLYVMSLCAVQGQLLSRASAFGLACIAVSFLASGTRAILLMTLMALFLSTVLRGFPWQDRLAKLARQGRFQFVYFVLIAGVVAVAVYGIGARFSSLPGQSNVFLDSIVNNNDMFRELAFVQINLAQYRPIDVLGAAISFALTPVSFLVPAFLGFNKSIPDHLITYNYQRAGIDIVSGQGNVFPGLIGDFHLVFGLGGAPALTVFLLCVFVLVAALSRSIVNTNQRAAYIISTFVYVFVSFRNIQGSLVLVILVGWALAQLLGPGRGRPSGIVSP